MFSMGVGRPGTYNESHTNPNVKQRSAPRILYKQFMRFPHSHSWWKRARLCTDLPGDVGLPAPPGLTEVLQDGSGLVLFDALGHHVQDVVHHSGTQLQVKVRLHTLFGDRLGYALGVTSCQGNKKVVLMFFCSRGFKPVSFIHLHRLNKYMHTFKLSGEQIPQPPLQQWSDSSHEKQPHSPAGSPEATAWTLAHRSLLIQNKEITL